MEIQSASSCDGNQLHLCVSVSGMTANRFRPCQPNVAVQQGAVFTFRFTALWNSFSWRDFECVRFIPVSNFVGVVSEVAQMGLLFITAFLHVSLRNAFILMVSRVVVSTSVASSFQGVCGTDSVLGRDYLDF